MRFFVFILFLAATFPALAKDGCKATLVGTTYFGAVIDNTCVIGLNDDFYDIQDQFNAISVLKENSIIIPHNLFTDGFKDKLNIMILNLMVDDNDNRYVREYKEHIAKREAAIERDTKTMERAVKAGCANVRPLRALVLG